MLPAIVLALAAATTPAEDLRQCQIALQFCTADGPVPLPTIVRQRSGSPEYDEAQRAAADLAASARRLARCAELGDLKDDCYREARDVRDAADRYEAASGAYRASDY